MAGNAAGAALRVTVSTNTEAHVAGAGLAAEQVGYESASQFSREFKRLFGVSPVEETARARRILGVPSMAMVE